MNYLFTNIYTILTLLTFVCQDCKNYPKGIEINKKQKSKNRINDYIFNKKQCLIMKILNDFPAQIKLKK